MKWRCVRHRIWTALELRYCTNIRKIAQPRTMDCKVAFLNAASDALSTPTTCTSTSTTGQSQCDERQLELLNDYWQTIQSRYAESRRFYHTMDHITEMLDLSRNHSPCSVAESSAVTLAAIFHDVIYDPQQQDNEEQSAQLFEEFATHTGMMEKNPGLCSAVNEMILATKAHCTEEHQTGTTGNTPLHYLLDLDMAVLGRTPERYAQYAKQIRQEYNHVPEPDYRKGRRNVLQRFLETPRIYTTTEFSSLLEERARENIKEEIRSLA